jgi:DNA-binding transcriptional regulator YiaG
MMMIRLAIFITEKASLLDLKVKPFFLIRKRYRNLIFRFRAENKGFSLFSGADYFLRPIVILLLYHGGGCCPLNYINANALMQFDKKMTSPYDKGVDNSYHLVKDIEVIKELLGLTREEAARLFHVDEATLYRWKKGQSIPSASSLESFYGFAYEKGIRINAIKEQLYADGLTKGIVLAHGSKAGVSYPLDLSHSQPLKDFGMGFYCGESLEQASSFVASYPHSCVYYYQFDPAGLRGLHFSLNTDWMLTIAYFRGRLNAYANHPDIQRLVAAVNAADYVVAPIADNSMFDLINRFIEGELSDEQVSHALSATSLGRQYVLRSESSLVHCLELERCYLCEQEKKDDLARATSLAKVSIDKSHLALKEYRGKGHFIEEILQ